MGRGESRRSPGRSVTGAKGSTSIADAPPSPSVADLLPSTSALLGPGEGFAAVLPDGTALTVDGIGTKARLHAEAGTWGRAAIDLVAMLVDDLVCVGAVPEAVLDILTLAEPDLHLEAAVAAGLTSAAAGARVEVVGGETAYLDGGEFALDGAGYGKLLHLLPGARAGDLIFGFPEAGIRCNGVGRALSLLGPRPELARPSRIYAPTVVRMLRECRVSAAAHITGGGWLNLHRAGMDVTMITNPLPIPGLMRELLGAARDEEEAYSTWNMGMGMAVAVDPESRRTASAIAARLDGRQVGQVG